VPVAVALGSLGKLGHFGSRRIWRRAKFSFADRRPGHKVRLCSTHESHVLHATAASSVELYKPDGSLRVRPYDPKGARQHDALLTIVASEENFQA
jgi:hypothetical protein